ncbi:terminase [Exiguobacterium sp. BMC-KP]|uniref:terminase small subunit n=1 Tax=Exiguobacterium sp. BMC-KP TaxID=1684312 RepID=UPI0006AA5791|nr:terminase small subunit [Exiguobacterium sp. BMC-KP]KOP29491.1 terminase [Exiguobacterium sp. BMC-KP]
MTPKQQRFCDEYLIDLNATQAAIRAGYSEKTAAVIGVQNLTKLNIRSYIDERMKSKTTALIASQDEVLEYLTGVLRGEEKGTVLVGQGQGFQIVSKETPTVSERTKAAELLGKRYRLFTDVTELEVKTPTFVEDVPEDD